MAKSVLVISRKRVEELAEKKSLCGQQKISLLKTKGDRNEERESMCEGEDQREG